MQFPVADQGGVLSDGKDRVAVVDKLFSSFHDDLLMLGINVANFFLFRAPSHTNTHTGYIMLSNVPLYTKLLPLPSAPLGLPHMPHPFPPALLLLSQLSYSPRASFPQAHHRTSGSSWPASL